MWRMYVSQHRTFGPWYQRVQRQPNWVLATAAVAAVLVIAVPVILLTLAAVVVGLAVFTVAGLVAAGLRVLSDLFTARPPRSPMHRQTDDGRRNVRILRR